MSKGYMSKCSSCGAACHSYAGWCPSCGMPNPVPESKSDRSDRIKSILFGFLVLFMGLVFMVIFGVLMAFGLIPGQRLQ